MSATMDNPAFRLASTVSQVYEMARDANVPAEHRQALLLQAHNLQAGLTRLVTMQFTNTPATYQKAIQDLRVLTDAINQAKQDVGKTVTVVNSASELAKSIDELLNEAMQMGVRVAKL